MIIPVVMRADLIAAGDHVGWNDLIYAAAAVACGQDIDVPETMLNFKILIPLCGSMGVHAARICTPGAAKSGCRHIIFK